MRECFVREAEKVRDSCTVKRARGAFGQPVSGPLLCSTGEQSAAEGHEDGLGVEVDVPADGHINADAVALDSLCDQRVVFHKLPEG